MMASRVTLSDEGEGWFPGYADLIGTIESVIQSSQDDNPYYVVRLDAPLERQESGAATPSGYILRHYSYCVIHCRWVGSDINVDAPVSVHLLLVPMGTPLPKTYADLIGMTMSVWADCLITTG